MKWFKRLLNILVATFLAARARSPSLASMTAAGLKIVIKFKRLLNILAATLLVGLVAIIGVVTLVDPNEFKGFIEKEVSARTGHILTIKGPIHWHLDPSLCLELYDLSVAKAQTASNTFLTLKKAKINPKFLSLFTGKLLINLQFQGLDANVDRHILGKISWDNLQKLLSGKKFNAQSRSLFFVPYNLTIEEATLNWQDLHTNQNFQIKDLSLSAKKLPLGIAGFLVPINSSFHYEDLTHGHSGNLSFNAEWCFNNELQKIDIQNLEFTDDMQDFPATKLTGELHIQRLKGSPIIEGKLQAINLRSQRWLSLFNLPYFPVMPKAIDLKSTFKYDAPFLDVASFVLSMDSEGTLGGSFKTNVEGRTFKTLSLNGIFHGKDLRIGKFPIAEIKTLLEAKKGIYHFTQTQAQFINSQHQGELKIDVTDPTPQFSLTDQMDSFDINELLTFLGEKDKLTGSSQVKATLTTQGTTVQECLHNLSGKAQVSLMNGNLRGIALSSLLQHAQSTITMLTDNLLKQQPINIAAVLTAELGEWKQQAINYQKLTTPFRLVETNITIDQGKMNTSDFELSHPEYTIRGQGTIDFIHEELEYQALALLSRATPSLNSSQSINAFLKETPLSIRVKGPLNKLSVNPELAPYAEKAIKLVQKRPIENSKDNNAFEELFGSP